MPTPKIMIISPDQSLVGRVCACLQIAGYQAACAVLGEGTLADLCAQSPDLLLLEWQYPSADTLVYVRRLRQDICLSHVPVVLMGVELREEDVLQALEAGADQCWREPFSPRVLVARVRAFFRRGNINETQPVSEKS